MIFRLIGNWEKTLPTVDPKLSHFFTFLVYKNPKIVPFGNVPKFSHFFEVFV